MLIDPPTEPIPDLAPLPFAKPTASPREPVPSLPANPSVFARSRFQFMTGVRSGETAYIRADDGSAILSYRSVASVVSIIAALMSAVVVVAGAAGVLFLLLEQRPLPAMGALILSAAFAAMIVMLIPPTNITIFEGASPVLTITQKSGGFRQLWTVETADGTTIARIQKSFFSRLGRNRWHLVSGVSRGEAVEESLGRAMLRKLFGKFSRSFQSNLRVLWDGDEAGRIVRRPDASGRADILDLQPALTLDRRAAVALAVLILGSEP